MTCRAKAKLVDAPPRIDCALIEIIAWRSISNNTNRLIVCYIAYYLNHRTVPDYAKDVYGIML